MSSIKEGVKTIHELEFVKAAKLMTQKFIKDHPEVDSVYLELVSKKHNTTNFVIKYVK